MKHQPSHSRMLVSAKTSFDNFSEFHWCHFSQRFFQHMFLNRSPEGRHYKSVLRA
jgi:hypothetical protein